MRTREIGKYNLMLLGLGLGLITTGIFGQLLLVLQSLGLPVLPEDAPSPWYTSLSIIPLGMILVALSVQLYRRSQQS